VGRVLGGTVNIFLSLLLGAVVFATIGWQFPEAMQSLLQSGGWVEDKIDRSGLPAEMNIWVMFLIQSEQIVFMGFVIISRIFLALLFGGLGRMIRGGY
jgi:hypothetical protein